MVPRRASSSPPPAASSSAAAPSSRPRSSCTRASESLPRSRASLQAASSVRTPLRPPGSTTPPSAPASSTTPTPSSSSRARPSRRTRTATTLRPSRTSSYTSTTAPARTHSRRRPLFSGPTSTIPTARRRRVCRVLLTRQAIATTRPKTPSHSTSTGLQVCSQPAASCSTTSSSPAPVTTCTTATLRTAMPMTSRRSSEISSTSCLWADWSRRTLREMRPRTRSRRTLLRRVTMRGVW
ncbi:hypothetical protein MPH_07774 [Macrophomina phaseolina MS6]|uniref:Uncharacterized protein n=1 Tax=Macrophomina phaseolina (strain MS6) TaxID=1126212 RepID=K2QYS2_MACPH|nr:hypothetical protein MPH_07774 [Macrophomina phaseolina MS6]